MPHAIQIYETGGPDVMRFEEVAVGEPGPGQARIRHAAVGLNYIDVYFRMGLYPAPSLPFSPGMEGAGEVLAVGEGITDLQVGDRVAYAGSLGAYAAERIIPADRLVRVPESVSDATAASMMLQGMTVQYLLKSSYPIQAGDTILFHAAAGGVGLIACQWAKHLGATVIGTVGSDEKAELARAHGCDHPIVYTRENVVERGPRADGRSGGPCRLRLRGPGHVRRLPRLPAAGRHDGELRAGIGADPAVRDRRAGGEGLALSPAAPP